MIKVLYGDCRETLRGVPDASVHCCVTSPPYWGLRSYLPVGHPLKGSEIGQERSPEAFVAALVSVFREVRRVLHPSGTCWLNLGDSYNAGTAAKRKASKDVQHGYWEKGGEFGDERVNCVGLAPKQLILMPWRVALALQADGWWVRSVICWHKKSCMPESVTDRPTSSWEPIFPLAKSARYFYDAEAVKEEGEGYGRSDWKQQQFKGGDPYLNHGGKGTHGTGGGSPTYQGGRNQRNVWSLGPEPYSEAHFATFPTEIPRRAILAGTSARGCCPKCLAPWERVVEREGETPRQKQEKRGRSEYASGQPLAAQGLDYAGGHGNNTRESRTLGWQCGCKCDAGEPIPCTVLDPFGGSGTTGAVALELGRTALLCELFEEGYGKFIRERTAVTPGLQLY